MQVIALILVSVKQYSFMEYLSKPPSRPNPFHRKRNIQVP